MGKNINMSTFSDISKKLLLSRTYKPNLTMSSVYAMNGEELLYRCKALELPWVSNQRNVSCIPEGEYNAVKELHQTKGKVFRLLYVRGRSGILVHVGNFVAGYQKDSEGCILPGLYFYDLNQDGMLDVADSSKAMDALWDVMDEKFKVVIV